MKRIAALALAVTFVVVGVAMAGEMEAQIQSIDTASKQMVLDNGTTLVWEEYTTILVFVEGKEGKLEDLKAGAKVKTSYQEKDGKNVVEKIEVTE